MLHLPSSCTRVNTTIKVRPPSSIRVCFLVAWILFFRNVQLHSRSEQCCKMLVIWHKDRGQAKSGCSSITARDRLFDQRAFTSSTSNSRVALGGMTPPAPLAP